MRKDTTDKNTGLFIPLFLLLAVMSNAYAQSQENWRVRFNSKKNEKHTEIKTFENGFAYKMNPVEKKSGNLYSYFHFKLNSPITGLEFDYKQQGDASKVGITLLDAAANRLWSYQGGTKASKKVALHGLKSKGQLVFRVEKEKGIAVTDAISHIVSNMKFTIDNSNPELDADGFILIDNITDLRSYAADNNVKVRLKPGPYKIDKAFCDRFIEFSGDNSHFDLTGVRIMVDTKLFTYQNLGIGRGKKSLYCVLEISGENTVMNGPYVETYGNYYGHQSKNKIFNLVGKQIQLKNAEVRTAGSNPWGYGSFYGLGGKDVRKMNGIRIGYPGDGVQLLSCKVHMRAMGHAIFVQGALNTLIEDCHVDGLLRTTDAILAEKSGYAFDKNFKAGKGGYIEGVTVAEDGTFLPGEMFSMSEDGIRLYPNNSPEHPTGSTIVKDCTVINMRRGICTGLNKAGDTVINCQVYNCIATGFNVGNEDVLTNCSADAKYAEAFCVPYLNAKNASVEMNILDSRNGMKNTLLAKINGTSHKVKIQTANPDFIPEQMAIKLSTKESYGNFNKKSVPMAKLIQLENLTECKILLLPGESNSAIKSNGKVIDKK